MHVLAYNLGCHGGDDDYIHALIDLFFATHGHSIIIYFSELDAQAHRDIEQSDDYTIFRHKPLRCNAMAFVIPKQLFSSLQGISFSGRAGLARFKFCHNSSYSQWMILGHHGGHEDELDNSLHSLAELLRQ